MRIRNRLASNLITLALVVLAGGFLASALVRYSPGFDSIPEDLNPDISPATLRALHEQRGRENSLPVFYALYLTHAIRGDFGVSQNLKLPVKELLRERAPVTARLILWGTAGGWLLGGLLAWMAVWPRRAALEAAASSIGGLLLAIPPAVLALVFFFYRAPLSLASAWPCRRASLGLCGRCSTTAMRPRRCSPRGREAFDRWRSQRGTCCWPRRHS